MRRKNSTSPINKSSLPRFFLISLLCTFSYLFALFLNSTTTTTTYSHSKSNISSFSSIVPSPPVDFSSPPVDFSPHHFLREDGGDPEEAIGFCAANYTDHCPCQDRNRERGYRVDNMFHRERHCPGADERLRCRVPRPPAYRRPFGWPHCRDRAWFANVPSKRLSQVKAGQNWVRVEGDQLVFPGGGTSFPDGVKRYVADLGRIVPIRGGEIRTALDIGCGVASFGGHLLDYNILTLSVAPRDVHEAQVQFALERGLPAMLGVLSVYRLPFPSRSFDMAHCARCLIQWSGYGGLYLLEIDRVLRPGGYWVLSGPPINYRRMYKGWKRPLKDLKAEQTAVENLAKQLCWKKIKEKSGIAVWRKNSNHIHCAKKSKILKSVPFCEATDLDAAWYKKMDTCISPLPDVEAIGDTAGGVIEKWPKRLNAIPPRIRSGSIMGITAERFSSDNKIWNHRLTHYERYINFTGNYRNIIDMNAGLGGFAAALAKYPVWVMNTVPSDANNNTLGAIYERGLIGTSMDWCEAFSTYPRTYDLIHANWIFSMYMGKCGIIDILLEMDRILRPEGAVIIRDHVDFLVKVKRASDRLSWQSQIVHNEKGPSDPEMILIVDNSVHKTVKP